jgi:selenide,water dikinase
MFAVGDCATLDEFPDTPKAGVYAVRQGPILMRNLRAVAAGGGLESYRPQADFLTLLNLGDGSALGTKWGRTFEGRWVMWLKDRIDRRFMKRFQTSYR